MVPALFLSGVLFLASLISAESVLTVTDATFNQVINDNEFVLVEFYAPWCGHCKSLAPEYEKAAEALKNNEATSKIILAKVDATTESKSAGEYGVQGFPTLKWFVKGKALEYSGGRTSETIINWVKKKTGPATTTLSSAAEVEKFHSDAEVVAIIAASEPNAAFEAAAQSLDIPFGAAINPSAETLKALGLEKPGFIVVFKNFDEKRAQTPVTADTTTDAIVSFVEGHSLPLIVPFNQETAQKIFGGGVKQHVIIFTDKKNAEQFEEVKKQAQPVAEELRGKYLFVTVDKSDTRVTEFFGVTEKDIPTARIIELSETGIKKFKLVKETVNTEILRESCKKHAANELTLDLKSEEIPATNDGDVKVLVGKNFDAIVKQPGKDVFVEFYAPWCGHCKQLAPKWEELGKWARDKPNLIIAKMDATANEVGSVSVSGFPTLKLFKADSDEIVDYDDARELESMIAFLEKNAASCAA